MRTVLSDVKYIWLNMIVNHIPIWTVRCVLYRMAGMQIGRRCRIGIGTIVVRPKGISLGDGCIINEYCHLDGRGGLRIGNETSISIYTRIVSASHDINSQEFSYLSGKVNIGSHVFIGAGAYILQDTIIEEGVVIGAGSVAKGTYSAYGVYCGNPAKYKSGRECSLNYKLYHNAYFR